MKIIPLSEGSFTIDKTKVFVPFDEEKHNLQERTKGSLLVEVQPFVIVTGDDIILLDAGLGFKNENGKLQIHQNLINNGINPSDITKVLMSHLHKDHSGGVGYSNNGEAPQLSFPNAKYYLQKQEFQSAISDVTASYIKEDLECLKDSPQVVFVEGNGTINNSIQYELTSAHSKFHQIFWIKDEDTTAFFGGDDAPQFNQMKSRYVAKYDFDGKKCMELRRQWWEKGSEEHWTFLFYHDIKTAIVKA